jgi:hypothetical protein
LSARHRRGPLLLALVAGLSGIGLAAVARGGDPPAEAVPSPYEPTPCDVLVMLTGREHGLLKPCGCTEPQRGGLERRAVLFEKSKAVAKASTAVSVGETLSMEHPLQNELKADLFRAALQEMGYAGMLLAAGDLTPIASVPLSMPYSGDPAGTPRPPLNMKLSPGGLAAHAAGVDPILRFTVGPWKARAVSVVDPTVRESFVAQKIADTVIEPETALAALQKEPGMLIVAAHVYRESLAKVVAAAEGRGDLVVVVDVPAETAYEKPVARQPVAATAKKPLLVSVGEMGKSAGLLRLFKTKDGWDVSYELVHLDPPFEEGASKARDEVSKLYASYRARVKEERLLEKRGSMSDGPATWVGSDSCKSCHAAIYASWKETPHARAMETLVTKGHDYDPECVRCHTVGWEISSLEQQWTRRASAFQTHEKTPHLENVGCENCHGPGSLHVKEPDKKDLFAPWRSSYLSIEAGKMWRDFGRAGCAVCHDVENSHGFNEANGYENYRPIVDHRDVPKELRTVKPAGGGEPAGGEPPAGAAPPDRGNAPK